MNLEDTKKLVETVRAATFDPEMAHSIEDNLYAEIIAWVAQAAPAPFSEVAKIALQTQGFSFPRWFA